MEHLAFLEKSAVKVLKDESVPTPLAMMGKKSQMWFEPLGTVLVISPWNYPFYQAIRSEEHTSELQSLMRISYAVFCLKKKNIYCLRTHHQTTTTIINII